MSADLYQLADRLAPPAAEDERAGTLSRGQRLRYKVWRSPSLFVGGAIVLLLVVVAICAPLIAPAGPNHAFDNGLNAYGQPLPPLRGRVLLGTDREDRHVLARLSHGAG